MNRTLAAGVVAVVCLQASLPAWPAPVRKRAPAAKKAPARPLPKAPAAALRAVRARQTVTALLGGYRATGLRASAASGPADFATLARRYPSLGALVSIDKVIADYNDAVGKGRALPGEKPPTSLADEKCPAGDKGCVPPLRRYQQLLPDVNGFAAYAWKNLLGHRKAMLGATKGMFGNLGAAVMVVDLLEDYGCRALSRRMPGYARVVTFKVPQGTFDTLVGDWEAKGDDYDASAAGKKKRPGPPKVGPYDGPHEETVEVCVVTHRQLGDTLRKDLLLLVGPLLGQGGGKVEPPIAWSKRGFNPGAAFDKVSLALQGAIRLDDGKPLSAQRIVRAQAICSGMGFKAAVVGDGKKFPRRVGCQTPFLGAAGYFPRCSKNLKGVTASATAAAKKFLAAFKATTPIQCTVDWDNECRRLHRSQYLYASSDQNMIVPCKVNPLVTASLLGGYLSQADIGELFSSYPELKGETFWLIARRLMGFRLKGGKARVFENYVKASGDLRAIRLPEDTVPAQFTKDRNDQNNPVNKKRRVNRAVLRRHVDQWTDGYEYERMTDYLQKVRPGSPRAAKGPPEGFGFDAGLYAALQQTAARPGMLWDLYRFTEKNQNEGFWQDCANLRDICQDPFDPEERAACIACAERAVREHCVGGKDSRGGCRGGTFINWLKAAIGPFTYGSSDERCRASAVAVTAIRYFFGVSNSPKDRKGAETNIGDQGMRFFEQLPLSAWQRCYLWTPKPAFDRNPKSCDGSFGKPASSPIDSNNGGFEAKFALMMRASGGWPVYQVPLFRLPWDEMKAGLRGRMPNADCSPPCRKGGHLECAVQDAKSVQAAFSDSGSGGNNAKEIGDSAGNAAMPIVGKLLGMLIEAAGMTDTMKTVAKAAGLTPEQASDCEDPEYRAEQLKIEAGSPRDNKRGCLTTLFAKNFGDVLESIIVMLGNKLVDWGIDILKGALQGAKMALLTSAASVPFIGGVLAALVEVTWMLVFDVGIKMLLKGLVVANIPKWLKVRELAKMRIEEFDKHPILTAVLGVVLQLIEAAVEYGNKSWLEVGAATIISGVQAALAKAAGASAEARFWYRALTYAKKAFNAEKKDGASLVDLSKQLGKAMVMGAGAAIGRNLDGKLRSDFDRSIGELADKVMAGDFKEIINLGTMANPERALTRVLSGFGPVVLGAVVGLVRMEPWVKSLLGGLYEALTGTAQDGIVGAIRDAICAAGKGLITSTGVDEDLKSLLLELLGDGGRGLCSVTAADVKAATPCKLAAAALRLAKPFLKRKVGKAVADSPVAAGKEKLEEGVEKLVDTVAGKLEDASCAVGKLDLRPHLGGLFVDFWKLRLPSWGGPLGWPDFKFPSLSFDFLFGKLGFFDWSLPSFDLGKFFLDWDFKLWLPRLSLALGSFSFGDFNLDFGGLLWGILNGIRLALPQCVDLSKKVGAMVRPLVSAVMDKLPARLKSAVGPKLNDLLRDNVDHLTMRDAIRKAVKAIVEELVKDERKRRFYLAAFDVLIEGFCDGEKLKKEAKQKLRDLFVSLLDLLSSQGKLGDATLKMISDKLFGELRALVVALFSEKPPKSASQWAGERLPAVAKDVLSHLAGPASPFGAVPERLRGLVRSLVGRIGTWLTDAKSLTQLGKTAGCPGAVEVVSGLMGDGLKAGAHGSSAFLAQLMQVAKGHVCALANPASIKGATNQLVKAMLQQVAKPASAFVQSLVGNATDFVVK